MNYLELWRVAWPAGATMLALGSGFAAVLLLAHEKLKVKVDPKVEQIRQALPQLDCGACGFPGCSQYAKAVLQNPDLIGKCAPGAQQTANKIAEILNLQISESGPAKRPVVHCRAHTNDKSYYAKYQGIPTCVSANALANIQACKFGCLGFGDCCDACKFDALKIVDGLAIVNYHKCTGCGACVKACPRNLIEMAPFNYENIITVACSSKEDGKTTRSMCKAGCIGCGLCAKQNEIFKVENNLARLDYEKYQPDQTIETAMNECPTKVIIPIGKTAQPAEKSASA